MRLRRIEIMGFKSFMERTVFTFPSRITGIVGPNGCGKTNVADAVLWAMGEMRPSHLRSRSMEDVIFNGTEQFKPLGMAEVNLVFENDGAIPLDGYGEFSEIMVTRRLYRSGESEYLINKVPCRLKDIRDLFLGTGVGVNAYSIIEQGQVDMLLNARPQDRRYLIEEAAGVTKYKERKKETAQKMELTRQNLVRVKDVIAEVRRQMNSLRRQAARARRYREFQKEIAGLEVGVASWEYGELSAKRAQLEQALQKARDEQQRGIAEAARIEGELEELKRRLLEEEGVLSRAQEEIYRIEGEIQREEERGRALEREVASLGALARQYEEEIEGIGKELEGIGGRREECQAELEQLRRRCAELQGALTEQGEKLQGVEQGCAAREGELDALREEVMESAARIARCQNLLEEVGRRQQANKEKRMRLERELNEVLLEGRGLEKKVAELQVAAEGVEKKRGLVADEFRRKEDALVRIQGEVSQKEGELKGVEGEIHRLEVHLASLAEMQRRFEGYTEGAKAVLSAKEDSVPGVLCSLAEVLEVDPQYEVAVEAALGELVQAIIVRGQADAIEAIRYLKEGKRGRGSFVPLEAARLVPSASPPVGGRVIAPLADLVRVKEGYRPLVERLLFGAWLVEDLADFFKEGALREANCLVTRQGDVWLRGGVMSGGSWEPSPTGILTRKRGIRETEEKLKETKARHQGLLEVLQRLRWQEEAARGELERLREEGYRLEREELRIGGELEEARRVLAAIRRKEESINLELAQVAMEEEGARDLMKGAYAEIGEATRTKEEKEGAIERLKEGLSTMRAQRDQLRQRVTGLQVELASFQERERNLLWTIEGLDRQEGARREERRKKEGQLAEVKGRIEEGLKEEAESRGMLERLIAERERRKGALAKEGEGVRGIRDDISSREEALKGVRGAIKAVEEEIASRGIALSQTDMEMRHICARIKERFGVDIPSLIAQQGYRPIEDLTGARQRLEELKGKVERLGEVNPAAVEEYEGLKKRFDFLESQRVDLEESIANLNKTIAEINRTSSARFAETFARANKEFQGLIPRLFGEGSKGELVLDDSGPEPGVEIRIQPAGKRLKDVNLLSGGEKALAAIAFIFALFLLRPTPFCLLDEVDAALDDANIHRFATVLKELSEQSQFILISHNKGTMEIADVLYGITMEDPGVSKVVSVRLQ